MQVNVAGILGVAEELFCPEYVHNSEIQSISPLQEVLV